jgi:hypothetical protein
MFFTARGFLHHLSLFAFLNPETYCNNASLNLLFLIRIEQNFTEDSSSKAESCKNSFYVL